MRVLILSVTAGYGHHATAKAVSDALISKGASVHTLDVYAYVSSVVKTTIDKGYLFSSKHMQTLYRLIYQLAENGQQGYYSSDTAPSMINIVNALGASRFAKVIAGYNPDVIVCTHVFAAQMVDELKKRRKLADITSIGIVTDYTIHPYWEIVPQIQYIVTASELLTYRCERRGIHADRVLPFGIPVHPKFNENISREDAATQLGINPALPTILMMGGSMGYADNLKNMQKILSLGFPLQVLCVCGNNKKQYLQMEKFVSQYDGTCIIHPYGFVDNVDIMMSASDCIITKPGGLTISEALAKNLPMILVDPIPGHEERNAEFLTNNGTALLVTKSFSIDEAIYYLYNAPNRIETMRSTMKAIAHSDASQTLADFIISCKA